MTLLLVAHSAIAQAPPSELPRIQHVHHASWGQADGLPTSPVWTLLRSPDGFLWIGTNDGLFRFDGARITGLDGLPDSALRSKKLGSWITLLVDRSGITWMGRPDGALVQYRDGVFRQVSPTDSMYAGWNAGLQDSRGIIWLHRGRRLFAWRDGHVTSPPLPRAVPDTGIIGVAADTAGGFWLGTFRQGLWHVTLAGATQVALEDTAHIAVRPLLQSRDGTLWVARRRLQTRRSGIWTTVLPPGLPIGIDPRAVTQDTHGAIWIATRGVGVLREREGAFEQFGAAEGLSSPVVNSVISDAEGSIWVGTTAGIDRLRDAPFTTLGRRDGVPFDGPWQIVAGKPGTLWASGGGSYQLHELAGGAIAGEPGMIRATPTPFRNWEPLTGDTSGAVWLRNMVGTALYRLRKPDTPPVRAALPPGTRPLLGCRSSDGTTWFALDTGGVIRVRNNRYDFVLLDTGVNPPRAEWIVGGAAGSIWISVARKPLILHVDSALTTTRIPIPALAGTVTRFALRGDTLWGATRVGLVRVVGGLARFVPVPRLVSSFGNQSLVLIPHSSELWFGSETGIGRLTFAALNAAMDGDTTTLTPTWFGPGDGLPTAALTSINFLAAFKSPDGRMWFSTPSGIAIYDSTFELRNTTPPQVAVESVAADDRAIALNEVATIAPNPARVELRFAATALRAPERARVEYRLDGVDRQWIRSGPARSVTYTSLRPGTYRFRVRAWNEDGVPSVREALASFAVAPSWYQAWWTQLIAASLAVIAVAGGASVSQRSIARRNAERMHARYEAMLEERTRIARELHDTLLQGFIGVSLELEALAPEIEISAPNASLRLARVLEHTDTALREARQTVWDIRVPDFEPGDLARTLAAAARDIIGELPITCSFTSRGVVRQIAPSLEIATLRICREALSNAVRHASPASIAVHLVFDPDCITLTVSDDGRGVSAEQLLRANQEGHFGVVGMRERAAAIGGTLDIVSEVGRGTLVTLHLRTGAGASSRQRGAVNA